MKVQICNLGPSLYEHFIKAVNTRDPLQLQIIENQLFIITDKHNKIETDIIIKGKILELLSKEKWYLKQLQRIFIICVDEILVINREDYKLIDTIKVLQNKTNNDIISITSNEENLIVAYLHPEIGHLGVNYYYINNNNIVTKKIFCHNSDILRFTLNKSGTFAATCSNFGLFLKIHNLDTESLHLKFIRGKLTTSSIHSLCFNHTSSLLASAHSSGYIKIFNTHLTEYSPRNKIDWVMSWLSKSTSNKRICKFFVSKAETKCEFISEEVLMGMIIVKLVYSKDGYMVKATMDFQTGECDVKKTKIDVENLN